MKRRRYVKFLACSLLFLSLFGFVACDGAKLSGTYKMSEVVLTGKTAQESVVHSVEIAKKLFGDSIANIGERIVLERNKAYFYGKDNRGLTATFRVNDDLEKKSKVFTFVKNREKIDFVKCEWSDLTGVKVLSITRQLGEELLVFVYVS